MPRFTCYANGDLIDVSPELETQSALSVSLEMVARLYRAYGDGFTFHLCTSDDGVTLDYQADGSRDGVFEVYIVNILCALADILGYMGCPVDEAGA